MADKIRISKVAYDGATATRTFPDTARGFKAANEAWGFLITDQFVSFGMYYAPHEETKYYAKARVFDRLARDHGSAR